MPLRTFHPEEIALLETIHANPRDDAPRLIYSDWLEEHDEEEQAKFIRLQIARSREIGYWFDGKYTREEERLVKKFGAQWRGARLMAHRQLPGSFYFKRFHRGLPDVERYTSNYSFEPESLGKSMEYIAPHYQVMVLLNVYLSSNFDPVPMLSLPIFSRAQRVYVRALGTVGGRTADVDLPDRVVEAVIQTFRERSMLYVEFGRMSFYAKNLVDQRLSRVVPTLTTAFPG